MLPSAIDRSLHQMFQGIVCLCFLPYCRLLFLMLLCKTKQEKDVDISKLDNLRDRYSCDYSRWSDAEFVPDDPASTEENEALKALQEERILGEFESANDEFCNRFKEDIETRRSEREERQKRAIKHRLQGNQQYKNKNYESALECYRKTLKEDPYAINILTNVALSYLKLQQWEDCLEFSSRAVHVDSRCIKALFQRSKAYHELGQTDKTMRDLQSALKLDPSNIEVAAYSESLREEIAETRVKKLIAEIVKSREQKCIKVDKSQYWEKLTLTLASQDNVDDCVDVHFLAIVDRFIEAIDSGTIKSIELVSNCRVFILFVEKSPLLRTYMRVAGHLNSLCRFVNRAATDSKRNQRMLSMTLDMFAACICQEPRSQSIVSEVRGCYSCYYHFACRRR